MTDARRGAEREPPRALLRTVRRHPWFGTVHGGPCPRDTRRALARRPCWDSHHGRRSAGAAFGTLRSGHAVPQSARSSAPFDPGVVSILPFARLGCPNRRGTVPESSMLMQELASNLTRSTPCRCDRVRFTSHTRSKTGADWGVPRRFEHPSLANQPTEATPRSNGADGDTLQLLGRIHHDPTTAVTTRLRAGVKRSIYRASAAQFGHGAVLGALWDQASHRVRLGIFLVTI